MFDQTHSLHGAKSLCHPLAFLLWLRWKATSLDLNPLLRTLLEAAPSLGLGSIVGVQVKYATEACLGLTGVTCTVVLHWGWGGAEAGAGILKTPTPQVTAMHSQD